MVFRLYLMAMLKLEGVADDGGDGVNDIDDVSLMMSMSMSMAMLMNRNSHNNHNSDNDQ